MSAGQSADAEAHRHLALAQAHEREAAQHYTTARNYSVAASTEKQTARILAPLAVEGYHFLADRQWPGSRRAQVDLVVIGPAGVFIVDTKAWAEVRIVDERMYRGQADVTDDVMNLADLAYKTEGALAAIGLAPGEVHATIALAGRSGIDERVPPVEVVGDGDLIRHIAARGQRLTDLQVNNVLTHALQFFPPVGAPAPSNATVPPVIVVQSDFGVDEQALISTADVEAALMAGKLAAPVEEWMTFLHPDQAKIVRRSFNGPSRIRGAAGTGKTVVGLHRAVYLARTKPGRVLVTTFVRTLPDVLSALLARMAPDVVDRVDFCGVHSFARRILDERGIDAPVHPVRASNAWNRAWNEHGRGSILERDRTPEQYWRDEIAQVIKARGITHFEQYADLARTGRKYRITLEQRRAVWSIYGAYTTALRETNTFDFHDTILMAAAELLREPTAEYSAVVVDEAQDLSAAAMRMLHALVGDQPDGLTLIGDGQQSIYPGGYTLSELGISVAGRGVVFDVNYRNTREVLEFAGRMVEGDEYSDIESDLGSASVLKVGAVASTISRSGEIPVIETFSNWAARTHAVIQRVEALTRDVGTGYGDVAVLCVGKKAATQIQEALEKAGIEAVSLLNYDGKPTSQVKVGTIKRAKGLEFKQVLLADVRTEWLAGTDGSFVAEGANGVGTDADSEQRALLRRELYVAMTRARDGLWIGVV